jgi:predicted DNA-binding ribbon-helix-helix protein
VLKSENEKLKQLSEERKNEVACLLSELSDLRSQMSNSVDTSFIKTNRKSDEKGRCAVD